MPTLWTEILLREKALVSKDPIIDQKQIHQQLRRCGVKADIGCTNERLFYRNGQGNILKSDTDTG